MKAPPVAMNPISGEYVVSDPKFEGAPTRKSKGADMERIMGELHREVMASMSMTVDGWLAHFGIDYETILLLVNEGKLERADVFGIEAYRPSGGWVDNSL